MSEQPAPPADESDSKLFQMAFDYVEESFNAGIYTPKGILNYIRSEAGPDVVQELKPYLNGALYAVRDMWAPDCHENWEDLLLSDDRHYEVADDEFEVEEDLPDSDDCTPAPTREHYSRSNREIEEADSLSPQILFLVAIAWWWYGIFTTFFQGRIPDYLWSTDFNWITPHNFVLGMVWTFVFGPLAIQDARIFSNFMSTIIIWQRGYIWLPVLILGMVVRLYLIVLLITAWFPQPLPQPFHKWTGGLINGLIFLASFMLIFRVTNTLLMKLMSRIIKHEPR